MLISDGVDELEIAVLEVLELPQAKGDLRLHVRVSSRGFHGTYDAVWISADEFSTFVDALESVERDRSGEAKVASMSPSDLDLRIRIRDPLGHVAAEGFLGRVSYGAGTSQNVEVKIGFSIEVDPTELPKIHKEFASFGASAG